jgi:hypothetical protein
MAESEGIWVVFLGPLILSVVGALFYLTTEARWQWKSLALGLVALSVVMQFAPAIRQSSFFLVPLFIQIIVCIWMAIEFKMQ